MASALILNGKVVDISDTEFDVHSDMVWVSNCPDDCKVGWLYDGSSFTDPFYESPEETASRNLLGLRQARNYRLAETDYLALSDNTLTTEMATYRQALRDITNTYQSMYDDGFSWPTKP